MAWESA